MCRMLAKVLEWWPSLLPPLGPRPTHRAQEPMHLFWTIVASDAVRCCQQSVLSCLDNATQADLLAKTESFTASPKLPPLSRELVVDANRRLFSLLGAPMTSLQALDELSSQHGQQLGMLLRSGANGCSSKRTSCKLRPADFCSTAALTALKLVAALLQAGEAEAAAQRARSLCQPSMTAADAAETDWQHLPPGHQWALACVPALSMLVVLGKDAAEPLKAPYVHFQNVMLSALPHQISRLTRRIAQQYGHPLAADGPLASSVACNSSKGTSHLPRQSLPTIDQEVLPLQAGTSLACQQTTLAAQKSHGSQRCGRPDAHDVDFKAIHLLKQQHRLTTVGLLTKRPEVKVPIELLRNSHHVSISLCCWCLLLYRLNFALSEVQANGKSSALRLELWDHQGAKLVVVVPFQHALFQQLQQEANQRLDSG